MKLCECGHTKETHFLKDGACYGFILVGDGAKKCTCTKFLKMRKKKEIVEDKIVPLYKEEPIEPAVESETPIKEWVEELMEEIDSYLDNKDYINMRELKELINKKAEKILK